ncbi:MAG: PrgI family protein, partial [Nanoarchaeota archaeon]
MAYDIPPPLEHKEKIVFGLSFSQLAYALPSLLLIFLIFFKFNLSIPLASAFSFFLVAIASFFIFFDGKHKLTYFFNHIRHQKISINSDALKKIIDIQKIEQNCIETKNSKLAVLEVIPLNFMIRTEEEQEAIIKGFQKFLNSLDFPVQIHISSHPIHLKEHFKVFNFKTTDLPELFDSYCKFMKQI